MRTADELHKWLPLNTTTLSLINSIALDLESSVMWYTTFKNYQIQPTGILIPHDGVKVDQITVIWASHERILESLAKNPHRGAFKAHSELAGLLDSRRKLDEARELAEDFESEG